MIYGEKFLTSTNNNTLSLESGVLVLEADANNIALLTEASNIMVLTEGGVADFFKNLLTRVKEWISKALGFVSNAISWIYLKAMGFIGKLLVALNKDKNLNESAVLEASKVKGFNMQKVYMRKDMNEELNNFDVFVEEYGSKLIGFNNKYSYELGDQMPDFETEKEALEWISGKHENFTNELSKITDIMNEKADHFEKIFTNISYEKVFEIHNSSCDSVDDALQFVAGQKKMFTKFQQSFKSLDHLLKYLKDRVLDPTEQTYKEFNEGIEKGLADGNDPSVKLISNMLNSYYPAVAKYMSISTNGITKSIKLFSKACKDNMASLVTIGQHVKDPDKLDIDSVKVPENFAGSLVTTTVIY